MKLAAVFVDYDGTIAPMGVRRSASRVPEPVDAALSSISSLVPVGVITSKDLGFVKGRTSFADGWACVLGSEVRLADGTGYIEKTETDLEAPLALAEKLLPRKVSVERKLASDGTMLGFSLDWTGMPKLRAPDVLHLVAAMRRCGLHVSYGRGDTFVDVYAVKTDKGAALESLKNLLSVGGPVLYLGDSSHDNPAFDVADVAVCVDHGQEMGGLRCRYRVDQGRVGELLGRLVASELEFVETPFLRQGGRKP
jgi:trehalose-6-phosphatase